MACLPISNEFLLLGLCLFSVLAGGDIGTAAEDGEEAMVDAR